jgi:hypothetical protein
MTDTITLRAALEQPQVNSPEIPEGWRLVPVEPTDSQIRAAQDTWWHACNCETYWDQIYAAMIAAAPQSPTVKDSLTSQQPQPRDFKPTPLFNAGEAGVFLERGAEQAQPVAVAVISRIPGGIKIDLAGEDLLLDLPDGEHKLYTAPPARNPNDTNLLRQALEALTSCTGVLHWPSLMPTIVALRERLGDKK